MAHKEKVGSVVVGYDTIENDKELFKKLNNIIKKEDIKKIVVGLPLSLSGSKTQQTIETEKFIELLEQKIDIAIESEDERLTSVQASKTNNRNIHEEAAKLILEGYLMKMQNAERKDLS